MSDKTQKTDEIESTANNTASEQKAEWIQQHEAREAERELIRERHRAVKTYEGIVYKHARPTPNPMDSSEKDVAVYARVSTKSLNQTSSITNQEHFYEDMVTKTPNWHLHEIYSDEGKSGTSTRHREAFMRMMEDARDGKFEMIICASVSRFARNISDCIDYVSELRTMNPRKPIGVYFETENLFTLNPESDQTLGFHALLADWESGNKSRRMILSYDQRIFINQFPVSDMLGYRHTKDGELLIVPEEAKTVRFIFLSFVAGYDAGQIAEILTEKQRPTLKGRIDWTPDMVRKILTNERRWGDLEARKTVVVDYKKKKTVRNDGIREGAFVPNHHEAIVSRGLARAAQLMSGSGLDMVPNIRVMEQGALKGFVSINPLWDGITGETMELACASVYSEEELREIHREARILSGEEHSNLLSMQFSGYRVPYGVYFMNAASPSLTVSVNRLRFSAACHTKLGSCKAAELLYHPILQVIAIRPCNADSPNAIHFVNDGGSTVLTFPTRAFSNAIYERMDWIRKYRFRFRGITRVRENARIMFFCLDEPRILVKNRLVPEPDNTDSSTRFIPYRNSDVQADTDSDVAYPAAWSASGISLELRHLRDRISESVSGTDILQTGIVFEDPLIGNIPSKEEVQEELDMLLESM